MNRMVFNSSPRHTIGVEIELALVDQKTMALTSAMPAIEKRLTEQQRITIKPELMQAYAEIVSGVCETVADAEIDLKQKIIALEKAAGEENVLLYWTATHPFSTWQEQNVTDEDRYHGLVNLLQDTARQLVTYGLHVHVGVDSGDKAIMICDRILSHLPTLLALSANSPWWEDRVTGLHSWRSKVMDGLPTAGLPPLMRNWSEYVWLLNHLMDTGFIESIREIWWDVRPHHNFGTVEVRICDVPGNLDDVLAITALVQCLVKALSDQIDEGTYQHDCHPMMVRQNKWRAARYGLDAQFVESQHYQTQPGREVVTQLANMLTPISKELQCDEYLKRIFDMAKRPTWADRQLAIFKETGDKAEVVRQLTAQSRLSKSAARC